MRGAACPSRSMRRKGASLLLPRSARPCATRPGAAASWGLREEIATGGGQHDNERKEDRAA